VISGLEQDRGLDLWRILVADWGIFAVDLGGGKGALELPVTPL
jgi:hypothetical protein